MNLNVMTANQHICKAGVAVCHRSVSRTLSILVLVAPELARAAPSTVGVGVLIMALLFAIGFIPWANIPTVGNKDNHQSIVDKRNPQ
jgi:hypothetical protein